jgi:hypothetical protein
MKMGGGEMSAASNGFGRCLTLALLVLLSTNSELCSGLPIDAHPAAASGDSSAPGVGVLEEVDCGVRKLAWSFAQTTLNGTCLPIDLVHDALNLDQCQKKTRGKDGTSDLFSQRALIADCRSEADWQNLLNFETDEKRGPREPVKEVHGEKLVRNISYFVVRSPTSGDMLPTTAGDRKFKTWMDLLKQKGKVPSMFESVIAAIHAVRKAPPEEKKVMRVSILQLRTRCDVHAFMAARDSSLCKTLTPQGCARACSFKHKRWWCSARGFTFSAIQALYG